jgi:hypothetical protein
MERVYFDSKIVQSSTSVENMFDKIIFSQSAFILNNSASFCAADDMFDKYSDRRYFSVFSFLLLGQEFSFRLFRRLNNGYSSK